MTNVLVVGAGKIGETIAYLLKHSGKYNVLLADNNTDLLKNTKENGIDTIQLNVQDTNKLEEVLEKNDYVISALPYFLNIDVATAAAKTNTHYFDLTEDVKVTDKIREIASTANVSFMPQCGLAPGYIGIAAHDLTKEFDTLDTVKLRVGALPRFPTNKLKYNLTWSTDGLINEYIHPCNAIVGGEKMTVPALEGYEKFILEGVEYEAFNTSGGLAYLAEFLEGRTQNLDYKTIRYPGHLEIIKLLFNDFHLRENPKALKEIFERSIPISYQDMVLVFISVSGKINEKFVEKVFTRTVFSQNINDKHFTAIQLTTAGSVCALVDMHANDQLPQKAFIRQGDVDFKKYKVNDFVKYYDHNIHL